MKNICLIALLVFSATATHAQFSLEGGINMANMAINVNGNKLNSSMKNGVATGFLIDMPLGTHVYFQSGMLYEMMGCKLKDPDGEYSLHQAGIPLNLVYKTGYRCQKRMFIGGGLHLGYNLAGSYNIAAAKNINDTSVTLDFGSGAYLKRIDMGIGVNFGYMLTKRFYFRLRYHFSTALLNKSEDKDNGLKTSAIGLNLGFLFGRCSRGGIANAFYSNEGNHWRGMSKGVYSRNRKNGYRLYHKLP